MSGPPAPGEDPEFDRLVEEEMARRANQGWKQQPQPMPPMPNRFEDDVNKEVQKLESYFQEQIKSVGNAVLHL